MRVDNLDRPAPGVCWTYRSDEIPDSIWTLLDEAGPVSPYITPRWSRFWERTWHDTRADFWVVGAQDGGVLALWTIKRTRWKWDWLFCQPYSSPGVFKACVPNDQDAVLLTDILLSTAGDKCVEVALSGDFTQIDPPGWRAKTHEYSAWVVDATEIDSKTLIASVSENHRRNIDKGRETSPEIREIYGPAEVERLQSRMKSSRSRDSRIVLNPQRGPLFAEVFAGSREMRWFAAWHNGRCAATCLWLVRGRQSVYVDGAVDARAADTGINHFLFLHALSDLFATGVRVFDLGGGPQGTTSAGLARFKEGWGAVPETRCERVFRTPLYHMLRRIV